MTMSDSPKGVLKSINAVLNITIDHAHKSGGQVRNYWLNLTKYSKIIISVSPLENLLNVCSIAYRMECLLNIIAQIV